MNHQAAFTQFFSELEDPRQTTKIAYPFFDVVFLTVCAAIGGQGESVNILLNFTQFFETRIEYRFQIFTAHSCDFLLPSYARLA